MKKVITTFTLAAILMMGATFASANDGIIVAGLTGDVETGDPCVEKSNDLGGIIVAGFTGIIVAGFTGIIVAGVTAEAPVKCGIIVAG